MIIVGKKRLYFLLLFILASTFLFKSSLVVAESIKE